MGFGDDKRDKVTARLTEIRDRLDGYIHRCLLREGTTPLEAALKQSFETGDDSLLPDSDLNRKPRLVVIGNSGSGKTLILTFAYSQAAGRFLNQEDVPLPFLLDLSKDLGTNSEIETALNGHNAGLFDRCKAESSAGCSLFLDGLDGAIRADPRFINNLAIFVKENADFIKHLTIVCHRAMWEGEWREKLPDGTVLYSSDHLGDDSYEEIIQDRASLRDFRRRCSDLQIAWMLDTPMNGFYLAREFSAGHTLPPSQRECFDQRINEMLRGTAGDRESGASPPLRCQRFLARQLACIASFSSKVSWTVQDAVDLIGSSTVLSATQPVNSGELRILLGRPLFYRTGDVFTFCHELFQEFLASEALRDLPLHKQRQLLETDTTGSQRVLPLYRGIAAGLSEMSEKFCQHLINTDPFVALMSERLPLSDEDLARWLKELIDSAIADRISPLWSYGPHGDYPSRMISKHRPPDPQGFLMAYLTHSDPFARLWGTACAEAWNGARGLNEVLDCIAHDTGEIDEVRKHAILAIAATKDRQSMQKLFDLVGDKDDTIRGAAVRVYRESENPSPRTYFGLLKGGSHQPRTTGLLHAEVWTFIDLLAASQLAEAFHAVDEIFEALSDLKGIILGDLLDRAIKHRFREIPAGLIIKRWTSDDYLSKRHTKFLDRLVSEDQSLFDETWNQVISLVAAKEWYYHQNRLSPKLAACCSDHIFSILPHSPQGLNEYQQWFVCEVMSLYFSRDPSQERLEEFKLRAPLFTQHLTVPQPKPDSSGQTPEPVRLGSVEITCKLNEAIEQDGGNVIATTGALMKAVFEIEKTPNRGQPGDQIIIKVLDQASESTRARTLEVLRQCVEEIRFECSKNGTTISKTRPIFEDIFWTLRHYDHEFSASKIAEVICCCAFQEVQKIPHYDELLEHLRNRDPNIWRNCVVRLLEDGIAYISNPIRYLINYRHDFYVSRCGERLAEDGFDDHLVEYLYEFRPDNYVEILRRCYLRMKRTNEQRTRPQPVEASGEEQVLAEFLTTLETGSQAFPPFAEFRPLLYLMCEDDEWAWSEFSERLSQADVPVQAERPSEFFGTDYRGFSIKPNRVSVFAKWYALVRRAMAESWMWDPLCKEILELMVSSDPQQTIRELRQLQRNDSFPGARFLSRTILDVEDQILSTGGPDWDAGVLLNFVNQEKFGVANREVDLFSWVCQAVEDLKDAMEKRGESVAGFWDQNRPKAEPECQGVLWPLLKLKLETYQIAEVSSPERLIGTNWCDFWVEIPRIGEQPLRVGIELKTAREGYGQADLVDPIDGQLCGKYLLPSACNHGIYVVLWFRKQEYDFPKHWTSPTELARELDQKCKEVQSSCGVRIASSVIDLTSPYRGQSSRRKTAPK